MQGENIGRSDYPDTSAARASSAALFLQRETSELTARSPDRGWWQAMLLRTLQRGELTGGKGWPRSCLDLPAAFLERLDAPERVSRDEKPREAMPALLRRLEQRILRHEDPKSAGFRDLVLTLGKRVCESSQQRSVFVDCCGDVLLVRLLQQLVPSEGGPLTAPSVINECVQILARRPLPLVHSWEPFP